MINPLIVAQDMFKTGFNEVEAKRYEDAHKVFLKVIDKASEGLANFEDKKIDIQTFMLCVFCLKLIMSSKIAKYCYSPETKSFLPYSNLSVSNQKLIAQEIEKLSNKCLILKKNVEVESSFLNPGKKKKKEANKEKSQNILDSFQQACYPYMSNGFGWTRSDKKLISSKLNFQVKPTYLPDGEDEKSFLHVGVFGQSIIRICVWVSENKLYVQFEGSKATNSFAINSETDLMDVELDVPVVISSSRGSLYFGGAYLGLFKYIGDHNGRGGQKRCSDTLSVHGKCSFCP